MGGYPEIPWDARGCDVFTRHGFTRRGTHDGRRRSAQDSRSQKSLRLRRALVLLSDLVRCHVRRSAAGGGGATHEEVSEEEEQEDGGDSADDDPQYDGAVPQRDREAARTERDQQRAAQLADLCARAEARRTEAAARRAAGNADAEARRVALPEQLQGRAAGQDLAPPTRPRREPRPIDRLIQRVGD